MCHILLYTVLRDLRPVFNQESEGWSRTFEDRKEEEGKERKEGDNVSLIM